MPDGFLMRWMWKDRGKVMKINFALLSSFAIFALLLNDFVWQ